MSRKQMSTTHATFNRRYNKGTDWPAYRRLQKQQKINCSIKNQVHQLGSWTNQQDLQCLNEHLRPRSENSYRNPGSRGNPPGSSRSEPDSPNNILGVPGTGCPYNVDPRERARFACCGIQPYPEDDAYKGVYDNRSLRKPAQQPCLPFTLEVTADQRRVGVLPGSKQQVSKRFSGCSGEPYQRRPKPGECCNTFNPYVHNIHGREVKSVVDTGLRNVSQTTKQWKATPKRCPPEYSVVPWQQQRARQIEKSRVPWKGPGRPPTPEIKGLEAVYGGGECYQYRDCYSGWFDNQYERPVQRRYAWGETCGAY